MSEDNKNHTSHILGDERERIFMCDHYEWDVWDERFLLCQSILEIGCVDYWLMAQCLEWETAPITSNSQCPLWKWEFMLKRNEGSITAQKPKNVNQPSDAHFSSALHIIDWGIEWRNEKWGESRRKNWNCKFAEFGNEEAMKGFINVVSN